MALYLKDIEITNIDNLVPQTGLDITELWFGSTNVYTVWQVYEGTLPATISANGADMRQYRIYGNTGGVGDDSGTAYGYEIDISTSDGTNVTTTPIYIGSDPLGADEYISYNEQKRVRFKPITKVAKVPSNSIATIVLLTTAKDSFVVTSGNTQKPYEAVSLSPTVEGSVHFSCDVFIEQLSALYGKLRIGIRNSQNTFIYRVDITNTGETHIDFSIDEVPANSYINILATDNRTNAGAYKYTVTNAEIILTSPADPPVPFPALPTCEGTTVVDYAGQSAAPEKVMFKYRKEGF